MGTPIYPPPESDLMSAPVSPMNGPALRNGQNAWQQGGRSFSQLKTNQPKIKGEHYFSVWNDAYGTFSTHCTFNSFALYPDLNQTDVF